MKIAVTYENGQVFQHFGHTAQFKLYDAENGAVVSSHKIHQAHEAFIQHVDFFVRLLHNVLLKSYLKISTTELLPSGSTSAASTARSEQAVSYTTPSRLTVS